MLSRNIHNKLIKLIIAVLPWMFVIVLGHYMLPNMYHLLCLSSYRRFFPVFLFGILMNNKLVKENFLIKFCAICFYLAFSVVYIWVIREVKDVLDYFVWLITNALGCVSWLYIFSVIENKCRIPQFLLNIGKNSLGIYVIHFIFIRILVYSIDFYRINSFLGMIIYSLCILLISYWMVMLIKKNKMVSFLIIGE